ncbi:unnamed protein product [Closterium sp. NIES-65]|nr:unnamed protein product [Closterium sp. NIES-65]
MKPRCLRVSSDGAQCGGRDVSTGGAGERDGMGTAEPAVTQRGGCSTDSPPGGAIDSGADRVASGRCAGSCGGGHELAQSRASAERGQRRSSECWSAEPNRKLGTSSVEDSRQRSRLGGDRCGRRCAQHVAERQLRLLRPALLLLALLSCGHSPLSPPAGPLAPARDAPARARRSALLVGATRAYFPFFPSFAQYSGPNEASATLATSSKDSATNVTSSDKSSSSNDTSSSGSDKSSSSGDTSSSGSDKSSSSGDTSSSGSDKSSSSNDTSSSGSDKSSSSNDTSSSGSDKSSSSGDTSSSGSDKSSSRNDTSSSGSDKSSSSGDTSSSGSDKSSSSNDTSSSGSDKSSSSGDTSSSGSDKSSSHNDTSSSGSDKSSSSGDTSSSGSDKSSSSNDTSSSGSDKSSSSGDTSSSGSDKSSSSGDTSSSGSDKSSSSNDTSSSGSDKSSSSGDTSSSGSDKSSSGSDTSSNSSEPSTDSSGGGSDTGGGGQSAEGWRAPWAKGGVAEAETVHLVLTRGARAAQAEVSRRGWRGWARLAVSREERRAECWGRAGKGVASGGRGAGVSCALLAGLRGCAGGKGRAVIALAEWNKSPASRLLPPAIPLFPRFFPSLFPLILPQLLPASLSAPRRVAPSGAATVGFPTPPHFSPFSHSLAPPTSPSLFSTTSSSRHSPARQPAPATDSAVVAAGLPELPRVGLKNEIRYEYGDARDSALLRTTMYTAVGASRDPALSAEFRAAVSRAEVTIAPPRSSADRYHTEVRVGSSQQAFSVVVDMASDLLWLPCDCVRCTDGPSSSATPTPFKPAESTTLTTMPCDSSSCSAWADDRSLSVGCSIAPDLPTPDSTCQYSLVSSSPQGSSAGNLVRDEVHLSLEDGSFLAPNLTFGCGRYQTGVLATDNGAPGGVLGLGTGPLSPLSQLAESGVVPRAGFALCLEGDDAAAAGGGSHLLLGTTDAGPASGSTRVYKNSLRWLALPRIGMTALVYVKIKDMRLGTADLVVTPDMFPPLSSTGAGGTALDSSSAASVLPRPAYMALATAFLVQYPLMKFASSESAQEGVDCLDANDYHQASIHDPLGVPTAVPPPSHSCWRAARAALTSPSPSLIVHAMPHPHPSTRPPPPRASMTPAEFLQQFPPLTLVLAGGKGSADFTIAPTNYLKIVPSSPHVVCFTVRMASSQAERAVIGDLWMRDKYLVIDMHKDTLSWIDANCTTGLAIIRNTTHTTTNTTSSSSPSPLFPTSPAPSGQPQPPFNSSSTNPPDGPPPPTAQPSTSPPSIFENSPGPTAAPPSIAPPSIPPPSLPPPSPPPPPPPPPPSPPPPNNPPPNPPPPPNNPPPNPPPPPNNPPPNPPPPPNNPPPANPPPPPSPPIEPPIAGCQPSPTDCAFFFAGHEGQVPTFSIQPRQGDAVLSTSELKTSIMGSDIQVLAGNSGEAQIVCAEGQGAGAGLGGGQGSGLTATAAMAMNDGAVTQDIGNQLYITGTDVQQRTFNRIENLFALRNAYVKLRVTAAEMDVFGMTVNMNPGDGNSYFPEDKRCVLFKTKLPDG